MRLPIRPAGKASPVATAALPPPIPAAGNPSVARSPPTPSARSHSTDILALSMFCVTVANILVLESYGEIVIAHPNS
uniref:Uncharacterized protein n=1 Tax=Oryza punctata TaxID=4537 RepID=A0A0E0K6S2_ORYPU